MADATGVPGNERLRGSHVALPMERPTYRTWAYWDAANPNEGPGYGSCHRHAPGFLSADIEHCFVAGDDWCGEHPDFPKFLRAREEAELEKLPMPF